MVVIETTAGQGTSMGYKFEHIRDILAGVAQPFALDLLNAAAAQGLGQAQRRQALGQLQGDAL